MEQRNEDLLWRPNVLISFFTTEFSTLQFFPDFRILSKTGFIMNYSFYEFGRSDF